MRKMTSWPATRMRLADRGVDHARATGPTSTIFDLETLAGSRDVRRADAQFPTGIEWVLVNGVVMIDHGKHTGARPGKVLYGPGRVAPVQ